MKLKFFFSFSADRELSDDSSVALASPDAIAIAGNDRSFFCIFFLILGHGNEPFKVLRNILISYYLTAQFTFIKWLIEFTLNYF